MVNSSGNLIKITVLTVIPLITFIALDVTLGLIFIKRDNIRISHPYFHHSLKKNSEVSAMWGDLEYTIKTNSLGFKGGNKDKVSQITGSKKRLVIIGDSFTEGLGYDFEDTFCGIIQEIFKDSVEVLNAGLTSYSPKLYYFKIDHFIKKGYKVDKLVVMLDLSDIQDEIIYENFRPSDEYGFFKKSDIYLQNYSFSYNKLFRNCIRNIFSGDSSLIPENILETKIIDRAGWTYKQDLYEKWGKDGLQSAKDYMLKLKTLCDENKIRLYIVVYPWPETLKYDNVNSRQVNIWSSFCAANIIDFIDLFPYFFEAGETEDVIRTYFIDGDDHWNAEGHKLVAEKLLEKI